VHRCRDIVVAQHFHIAYSASFPCDRLKSGCLSCHYTFELSTWCNRLLNDRLTSLMGLHIFCSRLLQAQSASSCIYKKSILSLQQRLDVVSQTAVFDYQHTNFRSTNGCTSNCLANIQLLLFSGELNVKINVKVLCALMFVPSMLAGGMWRRCVKQPVAAYERLADSWHPLQLV
jgi:hypothetical protein